MKEITDKQYLNLRNRVLHGLVFRLWCLRVSMGVGPSCDSHAGFGIVTSGTTRNEKNVIKETEGIIKLLKNYENFNIGLNDIKEELKRTYQKQHFKLDIKLKTRVHNYSVKEDNQIIDLYKTFM